MSTGPPTPFSGLRRPQKDYLGSPGPSQKELPATTHPPLQALGDLTC